MHARLLLMGTLAAAGLAVILGADAHAQYVPYYQSGTGRYQAPPVSPYLNLLRGNNTAVNYYLGVQAEKDRRLALQQQLIGEERQRLIVADLTAEEQLPYTKLAGTGHPATFMNYGNYYNYGGLPATQFGTLQGKKR